MPWLLIVVALLALWVWLQRRHRLSCEPNHERCEQPNTGPYDPYDYENWRWRHWPDDADL